MKIYLNISINHRYLRIFVMNKEDEGNTCCIIAPHNIKCGYLHLTAKISFMLVV